MNLPLTPVGELSASYQELFRVMGKLQARNEDADMIRRTYAVRVKSVSESTRSVRVIASTEAIDSYGEIVEQDWDLKRYQANPAVLYKHNQPAGFFGGLSAEETLPIGYATDVGVVDDALEATLNFVDDKASPLAEKVWQGYLQGSLRAVSVGFRSNNIEEHGDREDGDSEVVFVLSQNELFEISAVPMGANPEAVAKSADGQSVRECNREQLRRLVAKQVNPAASGPETEESDMSKKNTETPPVKAEAPSAPVVEAEKQAKPVEAPAPPPAVEPEAPPPEPIVEDEADEQLETDALAQLEYGDEDLAETCVLQAADLEAAQKALEAEAEVKAELEQSVKDATDQRDKAQAKVDELEGELNALCVKSYLGKKLVPAEKKAALEDCTREGRDKFAERMKARANLSLTDDVTGEDPTQDNDTSANGSRADRIVQKTLTNADKAAAEQAPSVKR